MVGWLLDTNIVSEWTKPRPDRAVGDFLKSHLRSEIWVSAVTLAELKRGVDALEPSPRRLTLAGWLKNDFMTMFHGQILYMDDFAIEALLELVDLGDRKRFAPNVVDVIIAATAIARNFIIVTRNVKDFKKLGVPVLNPFTGERFNGA